MDINEYLNNPIQIFLALGKETFKPADFSTGKN